MLCILGDIEKDNKAFGGRNMQSQRTINYAMCAERMI